MTESVRPIKVKVNRHGQAECQGTALNYTFQDIPDPKQPDRPVKGPFLGVEVLLDSGHTIYCQRDQLEACDSQPQVTA